MKIAKVLILLIAIAGVIAIGWFLLSDRDTEPMVAEDTTVKVDRQPAATAPTAEEAATPAQPAEQPAASEPTAPASTSEAVTSAVPAAEQMAALTPEEFGKIFAATNEAERAALVSDYLAATGEEAGLAVARKFSSGAPESRNYELSFQVAELLAADFDSRMGSYIAGTLTLNGRGTERDLESAMRYLRHPGLLETTSALYFRATILLDEGYQNPNPKNAIGLLKKVVKIGDEGHWAVAESQKLLEKLGAK